MKLVGAVEEPAAWRPKLAEATDGGGRGRSTLKRWPKQPRSDRVMIKQVIHLALRRTNLSMQGAEVVAIHCVFHANGSSQHVAGQLFDLPLVLFLNSSHLITPGRLLLRHLRVRRRRCSGSNHPSWSSRPGAGPGPLHSSSRGRSSRGRSSRR